MNSIILNIIVVTFPILIYFIYNCYRQLRSDKYNYLILDIALASSIYLCFKYGSFYSILFCNLPIIIAYLNKRVKTSILLSIINIVYIYTNFKINIILSITHFLTYLLIYYFNTKKKAIQSNYIIINIVITGFFVSIEYFKITNNSYITNITYLFIFMIIFYIISYILMNLFKLGNNITNLYQNLSDLEKDKNIQNSLFKITHEVKNPIAVCKGYIEMMDTKDIKKTTKYISIIKKEIDRSLDIMSDFMEFSKIKINKEIVDINMLIENIEEEFKIFTNNKNININVNYIDDEIFIEGDYNRLKQVFINLIKNSIEAMEKGGNININTKLTNNHYYIEIEDTGEGMDKETLNKVKEMFYTTKQNGSGLGVSLSNEIIKSHNGTLEYQSKLGKGTKVIVKLPIIMI